MYTAGAARPFVQTTGMAPATYGGYGSYASAPQVMYSRPPTTYGFPQTQYGTGGAPAPTTSSMPGQAKTSIRISASEEAAQAAATTKASASDEAFVEEKVRQPDILVLFSKTYCPFVQKAKGILNSLHPRPVMDVIELDVMGQPRHGPIQQVLRQKTGSSTVPQAFVNGTYVGGCQEMSDLHARGELLPTLQRLGCRMS
eukprot:gnl/TRDRNA2_/TRDRNA2_42310_c0_seq1.p1 gnl/TRDRNA2_/TRDRNA2_42310_c0~~gnl/TRDRNA2_/TRDRNA2_42310_c0_seq1.p1  ORF type:complete len:199 (+),score=34.40 gnl/TRDRNA2_/TRDRNA2_42310_c0_seq1:53-649(+)